MDRRGFLKLFGMATAGLALKEAIPFGRVWSFPSAIVIPTIEEYADLTIPHYTKEALSILRHKFRFEPDPLYLPPRSGKTIKWNRYSRLS
jgi:hypothetical protein